MEDMGILKDVLADLADGRGERARQRCQAGTAAGDPVALALAAVTDFWLGDFGESTRHASAAAAAARTAEARGLAWAAAALAYGGDTEWCAADPLPRALALVEAGEDDRWWAAVRYLVAEAALVSARLEAAVRALASGPAPAASWADHRFAAMTEVCAVRVAAFSGRIDEAVARLAPLRSRAAGGPLEPVVDAVAALVLGNADDHAATAVWVTADARTADRQRDFVARGIFLLHAYGAIAIGDVTTAATLVLQAGGDEGLSRCTIIDRALGLELLLVAALAEADLDAARSWWTSLAPLAEHPIARPTADRARSRLELALGDVAEATRLAERSAAACRSQGRRVEAAESEIVLARCRIAGDDVADASRRLRTMVVESDRSGHHAVRRAAAQTLGAVRRRLPPVAGGGWSALSERETEVARRILDGQEIDDIAVSMFLSPHTVKVHVSRVLCAFGVATRIGLLAAVGPTAVDGRQRRLTPRQRHVAELVALGRSNLEIAAELGVSVRTVEKHVADVLSRWDVDSRFGIARAWWSEQGRRQPVADYA